MLVKNTCIEGQHILHCWYDKLNCENGKMMSLKPYTWKAIDGIELEKIRIQLKQTAIMNLWCACVVKGFSHFLYTS